MKKFLPLLFIIFSIAASAQKIRFTDSRNHWLTNGSQTAEDCAFINYLYYGTDTIAYLHTYKQLVDSAIRPFNPFCSSSGGKGLAMLVREDTIANIVYYFNSADTMEHILYNYNLHVGDTIQYPVMSTYSGAPAVDSVFWIDSIMINGVYHKVFTMQGRNDSYPSAASNSYVARAYTLIEGVGCTVSPIFPAWFPGCFEYEELLLCFQQDSLLPAITTAHYLCNVYHPYMPTDSFRNGYNNCIPLAVPGIRKPIPSFTLYPNPATTQLTISSTENINQITITNLLGQTVYTNKYNAEKADVDVAALPAGIYFVKVNNTTVRKPACPVGRFVKE